jgi:hypothetical protein
MSSIQGVESLIGTGALAQAGWLLLRATQSLEGSQRCALVELVPTKLHVKSALGILGPIFFARLTRESNAGMTRGPNSFLFASDEREIGVLAQSNRITFVLVTPASSTSAETDLAEATSCERVDELLKEATKLMDKIALASSEDFDPSQLPPSWSSTRKKTVRRDTYETDDDDDDSGDRPLPPMTRKEWNEQLGAIAQAIGSDPDEFRAGVKAQIRARERARGEEDK